LILYDSEETETESNLPPFLVSLINLATIALRLHRVGDINPELHKRLYNSVIEYFYSSFFFKFQFSIFHLFQLINSLTFFIFIFIF